MNDGLLELEVVYAMPKQQLLITFRVAQGCTVRRAILVSGILEQIDCLDIDQLKIGIFSKACKMDELVKAGDRIEIYRPLQQNPMDARRQRASHHH